MKYESAQYLDRMYKKGNEEKDFDYGKQPDSTWVLNADKAPNKKLLVKGNGKVALINDFSFTTENGNDTTEDILNKKGNYYLLFIKDIPRNNDEWVQQFQSLYDANLKADIPSFVVTSAPIKEVHALLNLNIPIFTCDGTAIKTAARANPTLFLMKGPVIQNKWSGSDLPR